MAERHRYADLRVGMEASFSHRITGSAVDRFAALSGDDNELHLSDARARELGYAGRVVHGMYLAALLSRLVGVHLPGAHALYLAQTLDFARPAFVDDEVRVSGEITTMHDETHTLQIRTEIRRSPSGEQLVRGTATVKVVE